jgi:HEAT repeat protein
LLSDQDPKTRSAAVNALERVGPVAIPALVEVSKNQGPLHRLGAVSVLGRFYPGTNVVTDNLVAALDDADERVRAGAAYGLVDVRGRRPIEVMLKSLKLLVSAEKSNRRAAAIFLGSFESEAERVIPYLIRLLTDADGKVRLDAAASLGKIGQAALPALMVAARDESAELRDCARLIIERIEGQSQRVSKKSDEARD